MLTSNTLSWPDLFAMSVMQLKNRFIAKAGVAMVMDITITKANIRLITATDVLFRCIIIGFIAGKKHICNIMGVTIK